MFERFTEKAIKVIMLAQEEARRLGHNFVGTEQILLGLIGEGTGIAAHCLAAHGVNLAAARLEVEKIIGRGSGKVAVEIPFTPRAKRVLELSWDESRRLGHNYIGTEHLLLGMVREGEGVAARVLSILGVDPNRLREHVLMVLGAGRSADAPLPPQPVIPNDLEELRTSCLKWYSNDAVGLFKRAVDAARLTGSQHILPEHLILALIQNDDSIASALQLGGISAGQMRKELFKTLSDNDQSASSPTLFSEEAKAALGNAWLEAVNLSQNFVTQECICLGLLSQPDGALAKLLAVLGANLDAMRQSLLISVKTAQQATAGHSHVSQSGETQPAAFTEGAIKVIELAQEEARRLRRNYIGREQLLLGLIGQSKDQPADVLKELGVDLERARAEVENHIGPGNADCGEHIPFSREGSDLLAKSGPIARRLGDSRTDSDHLLLALVSEQNSIALTILKTFNVTGEAVQEKVLAGMAARRSISLAELQSKLQPAASAVSCAMALPQVGSGESESRYRLPLKRMGPYNPAMLPLLAFLFICIVFQGQLSSSGEHVSFPIAALAVAFVVLCAVFVSFLPIVGRSMEPAILDGDVVIGERLTKLLGRPFCRGEIVCFTVSKDVAKLIPKDVLTLFEDANPTTAPGHIFRLAFPHLVFAGKYFRFIFGLTLSKRIVGLPGEQIQVVGGRILVNGQELNQPWASGRQYDLLKLEDIGTGTYRPFAHNSAPIIVPADQYFVMGDNRSVHNLDSHIIGFVSRKSIAERVCWVFSRNSRLHFERLSTGEDPATLKSSDRSVSSVGSTALSMQGLLFGWWTDEAVKRIVLLLAFLIVPFALLYGQYHLSQTSFDDTCKLLNKMQPAKQQSYGE